MTFLYKHPSTSLSERPNKVNFKDLITQEVYDVGILKYINEIVWCRPHKLKLSVGDHIVPTITRTSSKLSNVTTNVALTSGDEIYFGDTIKVEYKLDSLNYIITGGKFNTTDITSSGQTFTIDSDVTITLYSDGTERWHNICNWYPCFEWDQTASVAPYRMIEIEPKSNGTYMEWEGDLYARVRVSGRIGWTGGCWSEFNGEFSYSGDNLIISCPEKPNAQLILQRPRMIGSGGKYVPCIECKRTIQDGTYAASIYFYAIEQWFFKDE